MQIHGAGEGDLEQTLRLDGQVQRRALTVRRDDQLWQNVLDQLRPVVKAMHTLAERHELQQQLLANACSDWEKRKIVNGLILQPINCANVDAVK